MHDDELEKLRQLATDFRAAIEKAVPSIFKQLGIMPHFPKDCCDHTSRLLLVHLHNAGMEGFELVTADLYKSRRSDQLDARHVWLEKDRVIIDITADQSKKIAAKVIVSKDSEWHSSLRIEARKRPGTEGEIESEYCRRILGTDPFRIAYGIICRFL